MTFITTGNSLEVECVTQNTKVEGSNLAADTIREKMAKRLGKWPAAVAQWQNN